MLWRKTTKDATMPNPLTESELRTLAGDVARLIEEEFAPNGCEIPPKWRGGKITLHPGSDTQSKEFSIDVFLKKLLTVRDALRLIEQKIGAAEGLESDEKASIQSYLSRAYGTLTSFNILFQREEDKFVGQGKVKETPQEKGLKAGLPRSPLNEF
jgi:hypothetical protein